MDVIILFFILGIILGLSKAEVRLPSAIYEFLSMVLLLTIGLKGGMELAKQPFFTLLPKIIVIGLIGFILPLLLFPILMKIGKFKRADAASIAAHYGSVSVGTFAVAISYLTSLKVAYEEYVALFVVVLEIPAILVGIVLAKGLQGKTDWGKVGHEVFLGKGVSLLIGGLLIGWFADSKGIEAISPFFFNLFKGILALFLLEMGLIASAQMSSLKKYGVFLVCFGVLVPVIFAIIGIFTGYFMNLSLGGTIVIATLFASASYIAVPAAMRMSVPEANPTLSLTASLGITFPFNILVGIPFYHYLTEIIVK